MSKQLIRADFAIEALEDEMTAPQETRADLQAYVEELEDADVAAAVDPYTSSVPYTG